MKEYNYWDGSDWTKVDEEWLSGVDLKNLVEVRWSGQDEIECIYRGKNGRYSVHYQDCYGTWGFPYIVRC